jgi:transposase
VADVRTIEQVAREPLAERRLAMALLGGFVGLVWPGLTPFVESSRVPLDNNAIERAFRTVVLGRTITTARARAAAP